MIGHDCVTVRDRSLDQSPPDPWACAPRPSWTRSPCAGCVREGRTAGRNPTPWTAVWCSLRGGARRGGSPPPWGARAARDAASRARRVERTARAVSAAPCDANKGGGTRPRPRYWTGPPYLSATAASAAAARAGRDALMTSLLDCSDIALCRYHGNCCGVRMRTQRQISLCSPFWSEQTVLSIYSGGYPWTFSVPVGCLALAVTAASAELWDPRYSRDRH